MADDPGQRGTDGWRPRMLGAIRYGLPAVVVLGGVIVMCLGRESDLEGGAGIISAGLAIYLVNWLFRVGVNGERERDAESTARDYYDLHGHWPEDAPDSAGRQPRADPPLSPPAAVRHSPRSRSHR